ncbi:hypothetical protein COOONC_23217 [Cooperia oncophora]
MPAAYSNTEVATDSRVLALIYRVKYLILSQVTPDYKSTFVFDNDFPSFTDFPDDGGNSENGGSDSRLCFSSWASLPIPGVDSAEDELFRQMEIRGVCRVICYHPDTKQSIATMSLEEVCRVRFWDMNELRVANPDRYSPIPSLFPHVHI